MSRFFIHRPVFAWVIAIVTMLLGMLGMTQLPVSQYPEVAPPTVRISATYTGASAEAVQNSVTSVIEDALTGLDGMVYMTSSSSRGSASVSVVFEQDEDGEDAQVRVQNKVSGVTSQLPTSVQQRGVTVSRSTSSILMIGALVSDDGARETIELADLMENSIQDSIERTEGVGSVNTFGSGYAMRIWLDPVKLKQFSLTPSDITSAVEAQNTNVSVGSIGDQPVVEAQQFTADVTAQSQLTTVDEFREILLKTTAEGAMVRLGDVARIEIGQESYGGDSSFNGKPAAGFGVNLATGANAVDTAAAVRETLDRLSGSLPEGVSIQIPYDTSPFVELSIEKVYHTLAEAIVLVFLVMLVFLQSWRATLIPTLAVPVVLLGTFGVLAIAGYSINTMTMFAMVLAIGLLVDDAIIVVENVERVMEEEGLPPMEATEQSMGQITGALIGTTAVLCAVFLPMAFFGGATGVIYRQFSVTIISAMVLSTVFALTLTPALCASLLRPKKGREIAPARWFNNGFQRTQDGYIRVLGRLLRIPLAAIAGLAVVVALAVLFYQRLPASFLPEEDQGVLMTMINLPSGSTTAQTAAAMTDVEDYLLNEESEGVEAVFGSLGFGFSGSSQNSAMLFVKLRDYDERLAMDGQSAAEIAGRATMAFAGDRRGRIFFMQPPAIMGMGNTDGFSAYLVDQGSNGHDALVRAAEDLVATGEASGELTNLRGAEDQQKTALRINIDRERAERLGLTLSSVNEMLSTIYSGTEVNDFQLGAELKPVIVQGDAPYRMQPDDIEDWNARNSDDEMVPFGAFSTVSWEDVPVSLDRYGGTAALSLSGSPADGISSGDAMDRMEALAADLDGGYGIAWTGISYQERLSGSQEGFLYAISALVVFLSLAALYESWTIPLAVMLAVPVGLMGALVGADLLGQSNDVYFKVGLLATIGLAAKNAILIVEFAVELQNQGKSLLDATLTAARQRLRPIVMTSLAFILGVLPLARATGAGAGAQNAIGSGVMGGMIAATLFGVFLIPSLFMVVRRVFGGWHKQKTDAVSPAE
ncbi:efflux RND transporter permease subunit [Paracoccus aurantiacus]|uniref:Efflux pump membrane transporter n=1 Tax=Paracoccus aurantiacus TaxID=2599412 RepID=A0A5C6S1Y1_9RHOB|nr:efflux RND transporter permease subunit [Paracoccus aurantiacus]TXB68599.1 efflux RND transporter permease subunit [Paracoccus aurantiacus]